jgi:hypothetical protein
LTPFKSDGYFYIPDEQISQAYADVTLFNCADASRIIGAMGYDYDEGLIAIFGSDGNQGMTDVIPWCFAERSNDPIGWAFSLTYSSSMQLCSSHVCSCIDPP